MSSSKAPVAKAEPRIGHNGGPPLLEEPLVVGPSKAWYLLDCGNTHGYELIAAGELESYLDGRSRRITMQSIKDYIARRLAATSAATAKPHEAMPAQPPTTLAPPRAPRHPRRAAGAAARHDLRTRGESSPATDDRCST